MRILSLMVLMALSGTVAADSVRGFCERDGKRLEFTDGIAFADAREGDTLTTNIYLTAKPLDRKSLAKCAECRGPLPESTFNSPRGDLIETQREAVSEGWMELHHTGGELNMSTLVNLMYIADDGTHTGLDGGNGKITLDTLTDQRATGKLTTEAREAPMSDTDMRCDVAFDLAVGWPQ